MMKRMVSAVAVLLGLTLSGCSKPAPAPQVEPPAQPAPSPVAEQTPAQPEGPAPCTGPVTAGPPSVAIVVNGVQMPLPMKDCAISLPAGRIRLYLLSGPNLPSQSLVQVVGAPEGRWGGERYMLDFDLAEGEERTVSLAVDRYHAGRPLTYTFTGAPAIEAVLAWGPSRQGPWTAITGAVVPPDATWLRISYPRPLKASSLSIVGEDQYAAPGKGLPGEWDGDRVQYVAVGDRQPVLFVKQTADQNGLQMELKGIYRLHRGAPPELQRVHPATGAVRSVYQSTIFPEVLRMQDGQVLWSDSVTVTAIDLATGQVVSTRPVTKAPTSQSYPSPDGRWVAELSYPDGAPGSIVEDRKWTVSITIRESGSGKGLVQLDRELITWGSDGCSRGTPDLGWRADSQALAVLDAPTKERLVLKEIDLNGAVRTVSEWNAPDAGYWQVEAEVNWSPSGQLIVVGPRLVEAATGRTVREKLPEHTFWSPDSRYLLLYDPDHPFTIWGEVGVLNLESGEHLALGHGKGLGWTPEGEALLVRWDVSKEIPPPSRGCS
jgi:hypothetical protein